MSEIVEDTITELFVSYLRKCGLNATLKASIVMINGKRGEPDIQIINDGIFFGEAKWEGDEWKGLAEAHDYGEAHEASGSFVICYPKGLKEKARQRRLIAMEPETILSEGRYSLAFLKRDKPTDIRRLSLEEIPSWIRSNIYEKVAEKPDLEEVVKILRQTASVLTTEIGDPSAKPQLFQSILALLLSDEKLKASARAAAGFLLVNQIAFYRILSAYKGYQKINPETLEDPQELNEYFDQVEDYSPVFSFGVASEFSSKSLPLLKSAIKAIYALAPEHLDRDILGKVFHTLIPLEIRKPIAAYYTKAEAAEILSHLAIDDPGKKVIDLACGSGTLLAASYRRKTHLLQRIREPTEKDHKRFLEQELSGIDIMPFAAHLSTIHLALQAPIYETEEVRIGIYDSTKTKPGFKIPPMSRVLPEARKQRRMDDFIHETDWSHEKIETGAVRLDAKPGRELKLDYADVVIMNPPFTRQETIAEFSPEYKGKLETRFSKRKGIIDKRMSYYSYFVLLADKFLKKGKLAAVLPATILRKNTERKLRKMLLEEYNIRYIIVREDKPNFSEDTDFREILFVASKGNPTNSVCFVILRKLDSSLIPTIEHVSKITEEGEIALERDFEIRKLSRNELEVRNLYLPISTNNYEMVRIWKSFLATKKLVEIPMILQKFKAEIVRGIETARDGSIQAMSIHDKNAERLRKEDVWIFESIYDDNIIIRHRYKKKDSIMEIPSESVCPSLRTLSGTDTIDISDRNEFVVRSSFSELKKFLAYGKNKPENMISTRFIRNWKRYVDKRATHLSIARRLDISAGGTCLLSFYSSKRRTPPGVMWSISNFPEEDSKIFSLWYNSTINILQLLVERVETRGAWIEFHEYVINELFALDSSSLSIKEKDKFLSLFEQIRGVRFPSVWKQLAMNLEENVLSHEQREEFKEIFKDFDNFIGKKFEPRRKIDEAFLNLFDVPNEKYDELLSKLYFGLLNEIAVLKKMMQK